MPHIRLEYSANIDHITKWDQLLYPVHIKLNQLAGIDIENCKSRISKCDPFLVGRGGKQQAFIHLEVKILEGRTQDIKTKLGMALLELIKESLPGHQLTPDLQITVEISDIERKYYFKHPAPRPEAKSTTP